MKHFFFKAKRFFCGFFSIIGELSYLPLIYFSLANTVTSEFILSAIGVGLIFWFISLFTTRHYHTLVENLGQDIVFFVLFLNLIYSRVIVSHHGETNEILRYLYIYWPIVIIVKTRNHIKKYRWDEEGYRLDQRIKQFELKRMLERDD